MSKEMSIKQGHTVACRRAPPRSIKRDFGETARATTQHLQCLVLKFGHAQVGRQARAELSVAGSPANRGTCWVGEEHQKHFRRCHDLMIFIESKTNQY